MSAALLQRIEKLEAENAYLRDALACHLVTPPEWRLTAKQISILAVLYRCVSGNCSRDRIEAGAYSTLTYPPESNVVSVHVSRLRKILRERVGGEGIHCTHGLGYQLAAEARAALDAVNGKDERSAA